VTTTEPEPLAANPRLEVLDDDECMQLLAREPVGRIALTSGALPVVLPVNFALVDRAIVFASEPGLKLHAARAQQIACFEVDGHDVFAHSGWSVLATGQLAEIRDPDRLAAARQLPLSPWALGYPGHFVELPIELLSGRRIGRR
jgi:hypothetical protein